MTQAMRNVAVITLAFLIGACVTVGHIQQTAPVQTMKFTGDHKAVAQCIRERLGAKVQDDSFGERYVVYAAVKGRAHEGLTHYSVTVGRTGADQGFAELRVMRPPRHGTSTGAQPVAPLSLAALEEYWTPVRECAARAKP